MGGVGYAYDATLSRCSRKRGVHTTSGENEVVEKGIPCLFAIYYDWAVKKDTGEVVSSYFLKVAGGAYGTRVG